MASRKCKSCNEFTILRKPTKEKIGVAVCDKYRMALGFVAEEQIENLCCSERLNSNKYS